MPQTEQGALIDKNGQPTKQAFDRLEAAIFAKAYKDDELIRLFSQAQDPEGRLVLSALAQLAPDMSRLEGTGALDIRDIVVDGAKAIINAKVRGIKLQDAAKQMDLDLLPDSKIVVELFAKNPRSNKQAIESLRKAAQFAYEEANRPEEDIFGLAPPKATREQVLGQFGEQYGKKVPQAVAEAERPGAAEAAAERPAAEPRAEAVPERGEAERPAEEFELKPQAPEE